LISDIRGLALRKNGAFDKMHDMNLQWAAIEQLCPVNSLVKFTTPELQKQYFWYAPGVILKQIFCNYGTHEVRLMIDGVPPKPRCYNSWELYIKMKFHNEHMRGSVYKMAQPSYSACLDSCFDCSVLWNTVSRYAKQNSMCPNQVLRTIIDSHVYIPGDFPGSLWHEYKWVPPSFSQRWSDVQWYLQNGLLMEAIAGLEAQGEDDPEDTDWTHMAQALSASQPSLAQRLSTVPKTQVLRADFIQLLGSLSEPFTLIKTAQNGLLDNVWDE